MSLAAADKLLKIFDALKNFREGIPVVDPNPLAKKKESLLSKKDRTSHLNSIPDLTCSSAIRSLSEFPRILAIAVDSLLSFCDDQESDVRLVAGESLNKLIKGLMDTCIGRIHVELYKEIKKNGSARSLRAALSRFGELCHFIKPQKCRPFIANLLPCIARTSLRSEEAVQETLASAMHKVMPVLGSFTNDTEIKQLLKTFLPNLKSSSATTRRTAASSLVVICQHSWKPNYFYGWLLNVLLGMVLPFLEDKDANIYLGALMCLRHVIPNLSAASSDQGSMRGMRGSFGSHRSNSLDTSNGDDGVKAKQLMQAYEVIMYCTKHNNHNVVTASLETLLQLLRTPPPTLLPVLLSCEGITPTITADSTHEGGDEAASDGDSALDELETASIAGSTTSTIDTGIGSSVVTDLEDDQVTADDMLRSPELDHLRLPHDQSEKSDDEDVFSDTMRQTSASIGLRNSRSLSDPGHSVVDGNFAHTETVRGVSEAGAYTDRKKSDSVSDELDPELTHCDDNGDDDDDAIRTESISTQEVKLLLERSFQIDAVACRGVPLVHCVRLMCSFLLSGNPGEMLADSSVRVSVKSLALSCIAQAVRLYPEAFLVRILPDGPEDDVEQLRHTSPQLVRDILLFSGHGDPQLRGSLASVIGSVIETGLKKGRLDFDTWCIDSCQEMETAPLALEDLVSVLKVLFQDESPVAIRQACISLKSCFTSLCCSKHSKLALDLIDVLVQLKNNSYWLVKVELLEILENIDFRLLTFLRTKFKSQKLATPRLFKSSVQEDLINGIVLHLLDDDDIRVRQAAARCMVRLVPQLFYSLEKSLQAAAISTSQSQLSNLNLYQNQRQLYEQAVIEGNLSRVVELVTNKLNHSTSRTSTLGCFRVLSLLIETFPAASHPAAWGCSVSVSCRSPLPTQTVGTFSGPPRPSSPSAACTGGGGPLATAVGCMTSSWLAYDLLAHQHLLQIAGNIMFGAGCSGVQVSLKMFSDREYPEEPVSSLENWSVFSDTSLAPQAEKLMLHLARLLNIFSHVIDNVNPGAHSFKISFPGQHKEKQSSVPVPGMATPQIPSSSPGSTPGSAVPKRLLTKTKRALSEADLLQGSSDKSPAPAKSTAGQAPETENSQNPSPKSSIGTFHHLPHYMKLFEILKGAFANNQVTLMDPTHDKFCQFVTATLETLALFLEVIAFADIGKHVEELLGYLQVCVKAESLKTFLCVQQLLRAMFGINALSQPDLAQAPVFPPCLADTQVTMPTFTDKQQSMQGRLYHTCFVQPMALLSQTLEKLRRTDECKGNEKEVEATGLIGSLFKKITKKVTTSVRPAVKLDKQSPIHSYIRLFETLVIRALKEYTMSSSVPLQQQVLSLLAQLVKLRVNYSLLDADQVFISYVQKQFEYIDAGQIRACDTFLPHVFQFLVLLSYQCYQPKFNQAKAIVGMPRIIQLCDGIMAGGQPARTHAIPALQPIVYDLFVLRAAGKSDVSNELETQREVVVSMLFRLIHYSEVLEMLVTILNCYQYDHGKWKKLSSEVMDLLVSDLVSQKVQVESEYGMEMLQSLLAAVAPVALDPIDVLLKPLFSSVSQAWSEISKRWLASTVVILHTIMAQVTEDTLLARINKSGLRPDCFHLADTSLLPQEMFVKFLFHVVEVAASHIHSVTRDPSVDPTFLTDDLCLKLFSNLLVSLVHILKSANFKKVYQVAASFRLIEPSVSRVNEILPDLVDTHPALVLQWCQVLRQLKYSDSQFWCAFMDKGSRLSTASGSSFELEGPTLNKEITRLGVILLYCDLLISQHMDQGELNLSYTDTLLKMSLVDLVEMAAEPPVHGLLSILYSSQVGSKLLLDAVTCSRDIDEAVKQPRFLKDLLSSLNGVHHSQSLQLVRMLVDRFLDSCHRSVVRIVERLICERLEVYRIGLKTDISQDLMEDDLRSICQSIAARNITNRSPSLSSLVNKVFPAKHPLDREMPSSDQLASSMSNYTIDQGWFFRLAEQCCFANNPSKQRIRAGSPTAAVKMLSALSFQEVSTIANHKDFDVSLLEECILRGVERTLLFTARRQNLEETGSSLYENAGHFESTGVDHLLVVAKLALFKHVERVTREVVQTRLFKDGDTGSKLACFYIAPERLSALCSDVTWCKEVTCLAKALVVLACAMPSLPRQCEVPQTDQESIFQFVFVPLSISHWNLVSGKVPSSDELKTHLDCLAKFLHLDWHKSVGELEFFPLVCSAISHVHALLDAGQAKNSQVELFSEETESDVAGNGVQFAMKACKEISLVVQRLLVLLKLDSESESTVPRFLIGPFQSVIVGLGRQPLVNNHARTLPLVWKMGWTPTPEGPLQTELPPLPIEILKEKDVLDEFVRRVNLLGWTSRQQFEETWAALLGVISSPPLPDTVSTEEDMESTHSCCLAVRCISELLLQTTLYPVPGSPCTSAYLHRPRNRDLPFLGSRAGKKLTFVRGIVEEEFVLISCLGAGRTFLCGEDVKAECCVSIHRANSFLCTNSPNTTWTTNRMLFDHPLYGLNIDRVLGFHDFTLGQVSIAALNNQAHAELQELSDSEDEGAIVVSVPRMPKPEKLDIKSCEQFLLELFEQWMSPYIQPRTPLALLSEATKALLVLSDLFVDGNHFEWVLETLLDLHHNHSTEDDLLTQYLLPTLCKALAFLKVEGPSAERVCKILETSIRSPHVPLQVSALYGAMYLLESHVPAVVAMLLPVLIDFLKKKLASLTSAVSLVEHHLLVMWSTAFYLLERYADEISDQEFKATVLKSAVRIASSSEDSTPTCVYHAIMRGLERLVVSFALTSAESDSLVKLSVDRLSMQDPQRAISALGLLITCMYTGKIGDRPSGIYPNPDTVEFPTEDRLLIAMERVTVLFDRIRKGFPSEAKVVARVLPSLLIDFFPAQEIMNKVIGEFLSSQQPHPELMAGVLFKVFEGLHSQGQQSEVRNWVLLSLGSFIQRKPLAMAVWSLTCFFVSASTSKWLRALFSHILGRMGKLEAIDVKYLCAAALDFFKNQNLDHTHKETFISTFQAVASTTAPYRELVECCLSHAKQPTICG